MFRKAPASIRKTGGKKEMALIKCSECGKEISDSAELCPHCGCKTKQGEQVTKAKGLLVNYVIVAVLMIIGAYLVFTSMTAIGDASSRYWSINRWFSSDEGLMTIFKLAIGIGFLVGGSIDMMTIKKKADALNAPVQPQAEEVQGEIEICAFEAIAEIPADKRRVGRCQMCNAQGAVAVCKIPGFTYDYDLCMKCINKYEAVIK